MKTLQVVNLGEKNSLFNQFIAEIRDNRIQKDRMRFRRNLERIGEVFAYEISKQMEFRSATVESPLGETNIFLPIEQPVVAAVLRAGLPLHQGVINYFDKADNAFISAYRMHHSDNEFEVRVEYSSCPDLNNRTLILCDTMLATGSSLLLSYQTFLEDYGSPQHTHLVTAIASAEGIEMLNQNIKTPTTLWVGAIDEELTAQAYIVPGLGDAGDLAFGSKD